MRVVFIGTGEIGLPVLRWLRESPEHELVGVVTQPDKPVGREQRIQAPPIKAALDGADVPVLQPERIKRPEAVEQVRALAPEVIVVMAYGQILPRAVLDIPPIACLNLHASLLPRHRGAAPIQSAILSGDADTGITVMYMDEGLDTGDILLKRTIAIAPDETGGSLHDRLAEISPGALAEALRLLESGNAPRIPQNTAEATYAPKLEREHGVIDCNEPAEQIARKIRAFDPWPGAYMLVQAPDGGSRKLKLFGAAQTTKADLRAGAVVPAASGSGLLIGASDGAVEVPQVQLAGRKRMSGAELLRGQPWLAQTAGI
jgi:methionyl-tRNA formyltransferase